jgi:hypothetical protein
VQRGKRYRLVMNNDSGDEHPVHLHRHSFEVTRVGNRQTSGVMKDTISMPRYSTAEIDFVADDPGNHALPLSPSGPHGRGLRRTDRLCLRRPPASKAGGMPSFGDIL